LAIAPDNPLALALKAAILEIEGDKQGAWTSARKALEINPASVEAAIAAANVAPENAHRAKNTHCNRA